MMRTIKILLLCLLVSGAASAQPPTWLANWYSYINTTLINGPAGGGTKLYVGNAFDSVASWIWRYGIIDTSHLSNRLNLKVNYSDTATMLNPYLPKWLAAVLYQPVGNYLNTSDTAAMLLPYLRKADTAAMLASYARLSALGSNAFTSTSYYPYSNPLGFISSYTETDPVFTASAAFGIVSSDLTHWNAAYNSYPSSLGFNTGTGLFTLTKRDGSTVTQSLDGRYLTSYTETDPVFLASTAHSIAGTDLTHWNQAYNKYPVSGSYSAGTITFTVNDANTWTVTGLQQGTVTSVAAGAGLSGGVWSTAGTISLPNVGTAGTYGDAVTIPTITTDAFGRVTGVATHTASVNTSTPTSGNGYIKAVSNLMTFSSTIPMTDIVGVNQAYISTLTGSSVGTATLSYTQSANICLVSPNIVLVSLLTTKSFTVPVTADHAQTFPIFIGSNANVNAVGKATIAAGSNVVNVFTSAGGGAWGTSTTSQVSTYVGELAIIKQ